MGLEHTISSTRRQVQAVQLEETRVNSVQVRAETIKMLSSLADLGFRFKQVPNSVVNSNASLPRGAWGDAPGACMLLANLHMLLCTLHFALFSLCTSFTALYCWTLCTCTTYCMLQAHGPPCLHFRAPPRSPARGTRHSGTSRSSPMLGNRRPSPPMDAASDHGRSFAVGPWASHTLAISKRSAQTSLACLDLSSNGQSCRAI